MIGAPVNQDTLTLYGSFTSSSSYKPMLYLALAGLRYSFRTVNLKIGVQNTPEYLATNRWGVVPSLRYRGLTFRLALGPRPPMTPAAAPLRAPQRGRAILR
jgi:hypothetical protein